MTSPVARNLFDFMTSFCDVFYIRLSLGYVCCRIIVSKQHFAFPRWLLRTHDYRKELYSSKIRVWEVPWWGSRDIPLTGTMELPCELDKVDDQTTWIYFMKFTLRKWTIFKGYFWMIDKKTVSYFSQNTLIILKEIDFKIIIMMTVWCLGKGGTPTM